ncbi:scavenger receptor class F member 1-like isoform X1 [Haliotis asinina]|uniref:scavenger receptor class F member 1-like isoform X1 n=2 Tax=Haliotis asinina TaxID=109174 RepID=UPI0035328044
MFSFTKALFYCRTSIKNDMWFRLLTVTVSLLVSTYFGKYAVESGRLCATNGCVHGNGHLKCQSCEIGCWGRNCSAQCWDNCHKDGCDRNTGQCFLCKPGFYGTHCDIPCSQGCSVSHLNSLSYCDQDTGVCRKTCKGDSTDKTCDGRCPPNCKDKTCDKVTAKCLAGCHWGWKGDFCNISCTNCLRGRCSTNGYCLDGCLSGFYGQMCERTCPNCWTSGCDRQTGICEQCQPGYHGHHCTKRCPDNCYVGQSGDKNCDRDTGRCSQGCKTGWHGSHCKTKCSPHCRSQCLSIDGSCVGGCVKGHYGKRCHNKCLMCKDNDCDDHGRCRQCPVGLYGDNCDQPCPLGCDTCDRLGRCGKCQDGFYRHRCDQPCPKGCDTCDLDGNCVSALDAGPGSSAASLYSETVLALGVVLYIIVTQV